MRCISLLLTACAPHLVTVVPAAGMDTGTGVAATDPTFEVVARAGSVKDPLPVSGSNVAYADLERALNQAVLRSVRPKHDHTLTVELVAASASFDRSRLSVSMVARATLRARVGNAFVAQTQVICRDAALVTPEDGAGVVTSCMAALARDLGGFLEAQ